jgi:RNA polymerase sigma-32 factor
MNTLVLRPQALPPITQFEAYARAVNLLPMLSEEEETRLAIDVQKNQNREAALQLICSHLRLPVKVARQHRGYGLPLDDLTQEGNIGLMKAVKKFDPTRGARLVTVALAWIRAEIRAYILKNWRMVKVATTKKLRHLFFTFRHEKQRLEQAGHRGGELDRLLADKLNVSLSELADIQMRLTSEIPLDAPLHDRQDDGVPLMLVDTLSAPTEASADEDTHVVIHSGLAQLPERTRRVLEARYFEEPPVTLSVLAKELGISVGRVAQIETQGLSRMKQWAQPLLGH